MPFISQGYGGPGNGYGGQPQPAPVSGYTAGSGAYGPAQGGYQQSSYPSYETYPAPADYSQSTVMIFEYFFIKIKIIERRSQV